MTFCFPLYFYSILLLPRWLRNCIIPSSVSALPCFPSFGIFEKRTPLPCVSRIAFNRIRRMQFPGKASFQSYRGLRKSQTKVLGLGLGLMRTMNAGRRGKVLSGFCHIPFAISRHLDNNEDDGHWEDGGWLFIRLKHIFIYN